MNKILVFVYGTLLSGQGNNHYLKNSKLLGKSITLGFTMHDLGAFPALVEQDLGLPDGENEIHGEVWEIDERTLDRLDYLEGVPHFYRRKVTETIFGPAWVYYNNAAVERHQIKSGNWVEYIERGE